MKDTHKILDLIPNWELWVDLQYKPFLKHNGLSFDITGEKSSGYALREYFWKAAEKWQFEKDNRYHPDYHFVSEIIQIWKQ